MAIYPGFCEVHEMDTKVVEGASFRDEMMKWSWVASKMHESG